VHNAWGRTHAALSTSEFPVYKVWTGKNSWG
jgi:hypothetical protein